MPKSEHELQILEAIERNPDTTQADLAAQLGVAVGSVNFVVKRLVTKGYVHVKQLQRRRLKYIITPKGLALRSKLAVDSLQYSMQLYRTTRTLAKQLVGEVLRQGYPAVSIGGDNDLAEIVTLTCLELGLPVKPAQPDLPNITNVGSVLTINWPADSSLSSR
jgi:DNA-binding MarR family transcriptional regulator